MEHSQHKNKYIKNDKALLRYCFAEGTVQAMYAVKKELIKVACFFIGFQKQKYNQTPSQFRAGRVKLTPHCTLDFNFS